MLTRIVVPNARTMALLVSLAATATAALVTGCSSSSTKSSDGACRPGDSVACTCSDGSQGTQTCGATACSCGDADAGREGDGGHLHDASPPDNDAAPGAFGGACATDKDCTDPAYSSCFIGGQRSFCTKTCAAPSDCPSPPTTGVCNNRGYCK